MAKTSVDLNSKKQSEKENFNDIAEKTRAAIRELESGKGKKFSNVANLMTDLDADD